MQRRTLLVLTGAAAVTGAAALLLTPRAPPPPPAPALAFPDLAQRLAGVARIEIRRGEAALALKRLGTDRWALPDKSDYPARGDKVREVLVGLTELRLIEPRTADADLLSRLGVEDPTQPGATSQLLRLLDGSGGVIAELVLGHRRMRTQGGLAGAQVPETIYIRRPSETQAWLAEGRLPVDSDLNLWLDRDIANLPRDRLRRVLTNRPADGSIELLRGGEPDGAFRIAIPADAGPPDEGGLDEVARAMEFLTFTDVRPEAENAGEPVGEASFTFTDGLGVTLHGRREAENLWITLSASGDDEAARLNARWRGWAYQVGPWKERAFFPRLADVVLAATPAPVAPTPPAPPAAPPAAPAAPR